MSSNLSIFLAFYSKWTTSREEYNSVFIVLTTYYATESLLFYISVVTKTTKIICLTCVSAGSDFAITSSSFSAFFNNSLLVIPTAVKTTLTNY